MRNPTKEEIESIDAYINNISETMIPLSVLQEIRREINKIYCGDKQEPFSRIAPKGFYITGDGVKEIVLEIIDTHISALSGKEQE